MKQTVDENRKATDKIVLFAVIALGAVLRIVSMYGSLTHDELSAICRLGYDSFSSLVAEGVKYGDVHPSGVQLFLYLWCSLFGTSAFAVRLPFVAMGIASIALIYAIARRLYGERAAIVPAAIMAFSQYGIYYSVMARPYAPGLFFMLCALYFWVRVTQEQNYSLKFLLPFALFEALCAYTHYFSLLSAFLLAAAGLLFVKRGKTGRYLLACLAAVLLFLPHVGITAYQLFEKKGIGGWLGTPTPHFLVDYFTYLLHHSIAAVIVAVIGFALLFSTKSLSRNAKTIGIFVAIWVAQFATGYLYSVLRNPLLQMSSLYFVWPMLLLAIAGCVDNGKSHTRYAIITGVYASVMVTTLVFERHHFQMMHKEWIEIAAEKCREARTLHGHSKVQCLLDVADDKVQYYYSQYDGLPREAANDCVMLDSLLAVQTADYLVCGGLHNNRAFAVIAKYFPRLVSVQNCVVSEVLVFGREHCPDSIATDSLLVFLAHSVLHKNGDEFQKIIDTTLGAFGRERFLYIDCSATVVVPDSMDSNVQLVVELLTNGKQKSWRSAAIDACAERCQDTCILRVAERTETYIAHRWQMPRSSLKVYLWNPDNDTAIQPIETTVSVYRTNPFIYSVLGEM